MQRIGRSSVRRVPAAVISVEVHGGASCARPKVITGNHVSARLTAIPLEEVDRIRIATSVDIIARYVGASDSATRKS